MSTILLRLQASNIIKQIPSIKLRSQSVALLKYMMDVTEPLYVNICVWIVTQMNAMCMLIVMTSQAISRLWKFASTIELFGWHVIVNGIWPQMRLASCEQNSKLVESNMQNFASSSIWQRRLFQPYSKCLIKVQYSMDNLCWWKIPYFIDWWKGWAILSSFKNKLIYMYPFIYIVIYSWFEIPSIAMARRNGIENHQAHNFKCSPPFDWWQVKWINEWNIYSWQHPPLVWLNYGIVCNID